MQPMGDGVGSSSDEMKNPGLLYFFGYIFFHDRLLSRWRRGQKEEQVCDLPTLLTGPATSLPPLCPLLLS
jgi:hypothetical protein